MLVFWEIFHELDEVIATLNEAGHSVSVLGNISRS